MVDEANPTEQAEPLDSEGIARAMEDRFSKEFEQAEKPEKSDGAPLKARQPDKTDDAPDATPDNADGLEEVEYEGETFHVPAKLKEAIIQKADYTRKTQDVAERQRNIELQAEQIRVHQLEREFEQTIAEPLNNLNLIESRTKLLLANWDKLSPDEKQEITYLDKQKEQIARDINAKKGEFDKGLQKSLGELRQKALDAVKKAIPNWSDTLAKDITEHALSEGYTNQELSSITDPRHMKTLWKAREYDRLKKAAVATPTKAATVKTGPSNPMPQKVKENFAFQKQMKQAQTPTQKARLIEERFAKQFGG